MTATNEDKLSKQGDRKEGAGQRGSVSGKKDISPRDTLSSGLCYRKHLWRAGSLSGLIWAVVLSRDIMDLRDCVQVVNIYDMKSSLRC